MEVGFVTAVRRGGLQPAALVRMLDPPPTSGGSENDDGHWGWRSSPLPGAAVAAAGANIAVAPALAGDAGLSYPPALPPPPTRTRLPVASGGSVGSKPAAAIYPPAVSAAAATTTVTAPTPRPGPRRRRTSAPTGGCPFSTFAGIRRGTRRRRPAVPARGRRPHRARRGGGRRGAHGRAVTGSSGDAGGDRSS